jgi:hypothetical protein
MPHWTSGLETKFFYYSLPREVSVKIVWCVSGPLSKHTTLVLLVVYRQAQWELNCPGLKPSKWACS